MTEAKLEKIAEGREAEIFAWEGGSVLRLMRSPDARGAVDHQARAMKAAAAAGVDVPEVRGVQDHAGRPGLVMERIDGPDMLTLVGKKPWLLFPGGRIFGRLHAQMHETVAPTELPELREAMRARIVRSKRVPDHLKTFALAELETLPDGDKQLHGDFHPANIIWTDARQAVIDWTGVSRGDPAADYARTMLMMRMADPPPGSPLPLRLLTLIGRSQMTRSYKRAYRAARPVDDALVARWDVPVMANRLEDGIEEEQAKIVRLLEERLAASRTP